MSEVKTEGAPPTEPVSDGLKNVKAEFSRKLEGVESQLKSTNDALLKLINQTGKSEPPPASQPKISDLLYEDPDKAVAIIAEQVSKTVRADVTKEVSERSREQQIMTNLYQEYPELADAENPLTKRALEVFDKLPADDKKSPSAYKLAVAEAALDVGMRPKSKRESSQGYSQNQDSFALGSSSAPKATTRPGKLSPDTEDFGRAMGFDMSDPKVRERIEKRARDPQEWLQFKPLK